MGGDKLFWMAYTGTQRFAWQMCFSRFSSFIILRSKCICADDVLLYFRVLDIWGVEQQLMEFWLGICNCSQSPDLPIFWDLCQLEQRRWLSTQSDFGHKCFASQGCPQHAASMSLCAYHPCMITWSVHAWSSDLIIAWILLPDWFSGFVKGCIPLSAYDFDSRTINWRMPQSIPPSP